MQFGEAIEQIDEWLDAGVSRAYKDEPLAQDWARISKIQEELGETVRAFIGATGQNPRKGYTHDMTSVVSELLDVACTALLAVQHFTKDDHETLDLFGRHLAHLAERIPGKVSQGD